MKLLQSPYFFARGALHRPYQRVFCTLPRFARIKRPIKVAARRTQRSTSTISRKIGDCEQSTYDPCCKFVTDDVIGCASTVVTHKINISANNEAILVKLGRDFAPYEIYQVVYRFDVAMATCSVPVSCLSKIKYYHLRLNKEKYLVLSKRYASPTFHWVSSLTFFV